MNSLMHYNIWMKQCSPVILNNFVVCHYQMRTSKRDLLCVFCLACTSQTELRLTLPHLPLPVLLITAPFVLIEYLLAYLFLITDSRYQIQASILDTHAHIMLLNAQLNPDCEMPTAIPQWATQ